MSSPSEFAGRGEFDFAAGFVTGVRAFNIDPVTFDLTSPLRGYGWRPGENVASCGAVGAIVATFMQQVLSEELRDGRPGHMWFARMPDGELIAANNRQDLIRYVFEHIREELSHPVPGPGCRCGFYAFNQASRDYEQPSGVHGVIQGYGRVVIGTRGFRAEKAKIVALTTESRTRTFLERIAGLRAPLIDPVIAEAQLRFRFPDVPIFPTFKAMVGEFPPDPPEKNPDAELA